jgi:hypothetical protein
MERKLSQKEQKEPVNKGYLHNTLENILESKNYVTKDYFHNTLEDVLESKNYVTKDYFHNTLENILESKNYVTKDYLKSQDYVTKDWALDMFETFQKSIENNLRADFQRHTNALMEMIRHENRIIVESIMSRVERVERFVGLDSV